ncbi:MAG: GNAT family N-acetyltransferase [Hyphomicrobiales bacterium]
MQVSNLSPQEFNAATGRLGEILADAVASGAGVSFMPPFSVKDGEAFWRGISGAVANGGKIVFVARDDSKIAGCVILDRAWQPNQRHRCEVAKLLVHRDYRRCGVGTLLMNALIEKARAMGHTLVNFDTVVNSPAEAFYRGLGFTCAGHIPGYALSPTGELDDTAIFYMKL